MSRTRATDPSAGENTAYPGHNLGLPRTGPGSVARWGTRITALVLDWAASMLIAVLAFGPGVLTAHGWRSWMVLAVFFVESSVLSAVAGGSLGQLITRITVCRLDRRTLGFLRAVARQLMVCVVVPALVLDENRRGLHDLACGTVVLSRR